MEKYPEHDHTRQTRRIADALERIADVMEEQAAHPHRVPHQREPVWAKRMERNMAADLATVLADLDTETSLVVNALTDLAAKVAAAPDTATAAALVQGEIDKLKAAVTAAGEDPAAPPAPPA